MAQDKLCGEFAIVLNTSKEKILGLIMEKLEDK